MLYSVDDWRVVLYSTLRNGAYPYQLEYGALVRYAERMGSMAPTWYAAYTVHG